MSLLLEFRSQVPGTLARPEQRGLWIATGGRLDEGLQVFDQGGIRLFQKRPARSGMAAALGRKVRVGPVVGMPEFAQANPNGRPRQAGGLGHQGDAASLERQRLASSPMATHPFVHQRTQQFKLASYFYCAT